MTANKLISQTEEPEQQPIEAVQLSDEAIANLTGYFDVLIQMDLALKESKKEVNDDSKRNSNHAS